MLYRKRLYCLALGLAASLLLSCGGGGSDDPATGSTNTSGNSSNNTAGGSTDSLVSVSTNDQGVFLPISSNSSDVVNIAGQSITLESGSGYIYRYVPEIPALERLDSTYNATNNYSCESAGTQKPFTVGQSLFNIEVCPNYSGSYSIIDVEKVDALSGVLIGNTCNLYLSGTSSISIQFTVIGDAMYYVDSSGNLMTRSASCGQASTLLTVGDSNNSGRYYGVNGNLISVKDDVYSNDRYLVRRHNLANGTIDSSLLTISVSDKANEVYRFYEGDDALYWDIYNQNTLQLSFYRYDLTTAPVEIMTTSLPDSRIEASAIDASGGKVLLSYKYVAARNSSGYATSWTVVTNIYDVSSKSLSTLDLGGNFQWSLQYMVYQ